MRRLRHRRQHAKHPAVVLARVRLAGHRQGALEPHFFRHPPVDRLHLVGVVVAQAHETGLRARGALGAAKVQRRQHVLQVLEVKHQVLQPQHGAAAHGGQLGGLEMRVPQRHHVPVRGGKPCQGVHDVDQTGADQLQCGAHLDEVGVIAHEGAGGAQMDDAARLRTLRAVGMDVRHDVVAQNFFLRLGHLEVDVLDVRPQLLDLRLADVQSHLRLGLGERHPQAAPGLKLVLRREDAAHVLAGVAVYQRVHVTLVIRGRVRHGLRPSQNTPS